MMKYQIIKFIGDEVSGFCVADVSPSIKVLEAISGLRHKLEKLHKETDRILQNTINEHKRSHGEVEDDLVDVLLKLQQQGSLEFPLTNENIKAVILEFSIDTVDRYVPSDFVIKHGFYFSDPLKHSLDVEPLQLV